MNLGITRERTKDQRAQGPGLLQLKAAIRHVAVIALLSGSAAGFLPRPFAIVAAFFSQLTPTATAPSSTICAGANRPPHQARPATRGVILFCHGTDLR